MKRALEEIENSTTRGINAYYRAKDESHKWPVCNKFNATERAIRKCQKVSRLTGYYYTAANIDAELSLSVNGV